MTPAPPPPEPPPPPPAPPSPFKWGSSFGVRVGARLQDPNQPKNMSAVHLDSYAYDTTAEARFHGSVTDYFSWVANFNANLEAPTLAVPGTVGVMDLIAQAKAADELQIWAGRLLVPSDRSNFSGPFFSLPWNYPGFYVPGAAPLGPHDGPTGRDQGITVWGNALEAKLKYYAGVYGLDQGSSTSTVPAGANPYYSARVSYSFQDAEPGYFGASTYYGAKNIATVGVSGQYQKATGGGSDAGIFMADALIEENVTGTGTFTFEGQFYKFSDNYVFGSLPGAGMAGPTLLGAPEEAFYLLAAYLTPSPIGFGKLQPLLRIQQTVDPGWTVFDAAIAYVFKDYSGRIIANYQHIDRGSSYVNPVQNAIQLGIQLQTL
jgi:hypothetical protein